MFYILSKIFSPILLLLHAWNVINMKNLLSQDSSFHLQSFQNFRCFIKRTVRQAKFYIMTSRKMRKSTMTGFGQYPDSVFKEQVRTFWNRIGGSFLCFQDSEDLHPQMVKQARRSGQLNLSGRGMVSVPDKVSLSLVDTDQVTWILASHWSRLSSSLDELGYYCWGVESDGVWRGGE